MGKHRIERHFVVGPTHRPGHAGTGRCQRFEAEALQRDGRANVEGVRQGEAPAVVQRAKLGAFFLGADGHERLQRARDPRRLARGALYVEPAVFLAADFR